MKKNIKLGFTLAEALMAMAIAGVIAALVMPPLISGTQNRKHATALGRSVEAIESGCQLLMQDASEKTADGEFFGHAQITIKDINSQSTNSTRIIENSALFTNASDAKYFNVIPLTAAQKGNYESSVKTFNGTGSLNPSLSSIVANYAKSQKLGAYYGVLELTQALIQQQNEDDPIVEYIYIDTNGENSPNRYGIDIYLFGLTDACHMIPAGTARMNSLITSIPTEANGCNNNISNGLSCTSRVVKDGYKINYKK